MTLTVQGPSLGPEQLEPVRQLAGEHPDWSRRRLLRALCERWDWRDPKGQLRDMAARALLLKLEARGRLVLPPRRRVAFNRMRCKPLRPVDHPREPIQGDLARLRPLAVRELSQWPGQWPLFEWRLYRYPYLGYTSAGGFNLKYRVLDRGGRPLACLLLGSAAWPCAPRDRFIGWSAPARQAHWQAVTNHTRLIVLPWVVVPRLASHALGPVARRLAQDWRRKYARPLVPVETFVDPSRFTGACYRAANWRELGQTTGRTRQDRAHRRALAPKQVWVYPLHPLFRTHLCG